MGRLILIFGENGSGKSRYAEKLAVKFAKKRFYLATMIPQTEENHERIEKHIRQREGLNFQTLECPYHVADSAVSPDSVVLLEDVSNLLSNVIFEKGGTAEMVLEDICGLLKRCEALVAVTIFNLDPKGYDGETAAYINALNQLNHALLQKSDAAVRMEHGSPVFSKGVLSHAEEVLMDRPLGV